jgi:hypothetical protein
MIKSITFLNRKDRIPYRDPILFSLKENVLGNDQLTQRASPQLPSALVALQVGNRDGL